jgi:hypothetical protein
VSDQPQTTDLHPWYGQCDTLGPDNTCFVCANQAAVKEVYKLVVWGTHYDEVPFDEAMRRPRYSHLRQITLERTLAILDSVRGR